MLEVKELSSGYNGVEVLHGVSVDVHKGEIVSLVGLNGAGKSTLLKTISSIVKATDGSIMLNSTEINRQSTDQLLKKGMVLVPENRMLFPILSVEENLLLGTAAKSKKYRREHFQEKLENVFELFPILKERIKQQVGTMSGGEQQMLAIARGLMSDPNLLLLDEPSLGIAPILVEKIYDVLTQLNKDGMTIFLVEQNVSMALEISDRGYVLDLGKIIMSGTGSELMSDSRIKEAYLGS
ncbi:ABC transporter ATP-binding protein [Aquibacillus saliphilus]|uniref:ABC transporter ATP-binding protein n=1 Tax=Aquibacillus saliphilus TaxID=1909422 RepID=UPI001CEFFF0F|nr:ABC transporter ATP-binding protein [Aquibacillus saliphilus]